MYSYISHIDTIAIREEIVSTAKFIGHRIKHTLEHYIGNSITIYKLHHLQVH